MLDDKPYDSHYDTTCFCGKVYKSELAMKLCWARNHAPITKLLDYKSKDQKGYKKRKGNGHRENLDRPRKMQLGRWVEKKGIKKYIPVFCKICKKPIKTKTILGNRSWYCVSCKAIKLQKFNVRIKLRKELYKAKYRKANEEFAATGRAID